MRRTAARRKADPTLHELRQPWVGGPIEDGGFRVQWIEPTTERDAAGNLEFYGPSTKVRAEIRVWFERNWFDQEKPNEIRRVQLTLADEITPTRLQRFPWRRALAVVDSVIRGFELNARARQGDPSANEEIWRQIEYNDALERKDRKPQAPTTSKPGRRGHPDEHYQDIAALYTKFRKQGLHNPTAGIATEYHVERSTAAGWVRRARERGHLPPARRGRAG
jgi:hypothetical protein